MNVSINQKELETLYTKGKSNKLPPQVVEKFFATIQKIEAATDIHDLLADNGLRFKKMQNSDSYAMRLNNKYRLEMQVEWDNDAQTVGHFILTNISVHYA